MNIVKKFFGHLKTTIIHKFWVFYYCCRLGIPFRGIVHDMSKFSPTEFFESVKYYSGTDSPINKCKEINGVSYAWLHHRGRNKHHLEYWIDDFDKGMVFKIIPYKYSVEMLCDFLGAGRAYNKDKFTYQKEYDWWINSGRSHYMNPKNGFFINTCLKYMAENNALPDKQFLKCTYETFSDVERKEDK